MQHLFLCTQGGACEPIDVARSQHSDAEDDFGQLDAYFRAANYLAAGQIYLMDNPLLRRPLIPGDIKPRLSRPLGDEPRAQLLLRPPKPLHQGSRTRCPLCVRSGPRCTGRRGQYLVGGHL